MSAVAPAGGPQAGEVAFHTGVADPVDHAVRLTRKALATGARVLVIGPEGPLMQLDERLWTHEAGSFLPHAVIQPDQPHATTAVRAPVWLMAASATPQEPPQVPAEREVLVNLGSAVPVNAQSFAKVIEVVGVPPEARSQGQQRWRAWRERGVNPTHHAFS